MELKETKCIYNGCARGEAQARFSVTKEEADELREALALIEKYESLGFYEGKEVVLESEWTMISFEVEDDEVVLKMEDGMIG